MANSNRVFVSPGVYTSEKDLTFVAQSVGVTTLGLAGETIQGPAFEPILIRNFDEFKTYFGPTSPVKFSDGNPKYELGYVAKSYLQESNQLFVTRVLGLTGYKPLKTFGIKTLGGITVDLDTLTNSQVNSLSGATPNANTDLSIAGSAFYNDLSDKTANDGTSIPDFITGLTVQDGTWFTIGHVDGNDTASLTDSLQITGPIGSNSNNNWYNTFFKEDGLGNIDGVYSYLFVWSTANNGWDISQYEWSAEVNADYDNMIVLALRSRGSYDGESLELEVTGNTDITISSTEIGSNPLGEFTLTAVGSTSGSKTFTCSLDVSSTKYVSKVLGSDVFDKKKGEFPVYVFEEYPNLLKSLHDLGLVRGLSTDVVYHDVDNDFLNQWDTPASPTIVSEVRGGTVSDLFSIVSISDGDAANNQVKIQIQNIDIETGEFDLIVRDFNDTDDNMSVLEKFSRCSMNPDLPGYIGRKIGTSDGEYELRSKYIMLNLAEDHPVDAFPAGFKGFTSDLLGTSKIGNILYKTKYNDAGDVIGYSSLGEPELTNGDKVRKVTLGLSSQIGLDSDLFHYKGNAASQTSHGFHLSVNAPTGYKTTPYDLEGADKGKLDSKSFRKFTLAVCGGFDGWDIYRGTRTNGDGHIFGKNTYVSGHTTNGGVFSSAVGNSDYYAYLQAIETFSNPESVDINIFATPGIDFYNHSSLVNQAIDMVEGDRADSLYIVNAPNTSDVDEIIDQLDTVDLDTNYTATYWPWIQVRDGDNATQLYIPPTGEVVKNIALTDNVSYPWFAVAGYQRGLVNAIKAKKKLTLDNRDDLYKARINPIATFSDTGTIIWGNKTLQVRESALDRINVRRLLLRARKLISAVAVRLLFEQNDEQVRNEFLRLVNPILESIKKERGLYEFRVTVSNDPEDIDANTLRGKIYVKPTRSLEFIDVEFLITPTGASFENI
jgi:hypothetical protein